MNNKIFYTFEATVPAILLVRSVFGSFSKKSSLTQNNTPSMPLSDAHLGGFFFLGHG